MIFLLLNQLYNFQQNLVTELTEVCRFWLH